MPGIIEFPKLVHDALAQYGDLFANECQRRHLAEYLTGLIVAERKTVLGIHDEFAQTTDQSCLNRFLTEVAHFADAPSPSFASSPDEQARFARWFLDRANETRPVFAVWLHLHDQPDAPAPFKHMGLVGDDGAVRPAYAAWVSAR